MIKQTTLKLIATAVFIVSLPFSAFAQVNPGFDPNKLIDDKIFADTQTFGGPEGVQKFLVAKNSVLANTSPEFLVKLKEPGITMLKEGLEDPHPNLGRLRTAAELIWDASMQSGLNPQVILVTLNKEQSLITGHQDSSPEKLQRALDHAMGFACPDSGGCSDIFPGFYFQLFGSFDAAGNRYLGAAKSLMKSYSTSGGRGPVINGQITKVGDTITLDNTMGGFDGIQSSQTIQLLNNATAALYRYTPHVFNGNYNFWRFFQEWFRYPNGTLLKIASGADTYIIQNGLKQLVPQFVAQARNLNLASTITVSPNEFDSYQTDKVLGPVDNTIVQIPGETRKFVFIDNVKHPASDFVIKQRGLEPSLVLSVTPSDLSYFQDGPVLTPKDGTIIKGAQDTGIYLVNNGSLQLFSAYVFGQRKVTAKQITVVPDEEMATYPKLGFVPPLDGTLIKAANDTTVYLVQSGLKQPVLGEIFKIRGFSFKKVASLSADEVSALPLGAYAMPKDYTFFAAGSKSGQLLEFKEGSTHAISGFVAKQRGITPDYVFSQEVVNSWPVGIPIPPRDNTIVKGDKDATVYLVSKAQLRPLTAKAFKNRKITAKKITTLPQAEVDAYAKGEVLAK